MEDHTRDGALRLGWMMVLVSGIILIGVSLGIAVTPLLVEEDFAGTTFVDLQKTNPRIADVIWHDAVAFGILLLGVSVLIALLAWKGLAQGSRLAWYSLTILGVTILAFLILAHVPIGHSLLHYGPVLILDGILLLGLAIAAKPIFSTAEGATSGTK